MTSSPLVFGCWFIARSLKVFAEAQEV